MHLAGDAGRSPVGSPYGRGLRLRPRRLLDRLRPRRGDPVIAGRTHVARFGQRHRAAAAGGGAPLLRLPDRRGPAGDQPGGAGRYTPGSGFGGHRDKGLVPRFTKLPWDPHEEHWLVRLQAAQEMPIRNRLMLALAYDAALRREELWSLRTEDYDPAHRTLTVRGAPQDAQRRRQARREGDHRSARRPCRARSL